MPTSKADPKEECAVCERILDAAMERFQRYGYTKTTMVEIATDTRMSAANLYRYFRNKQDIAAACASRCLDEQAELMRKVVRQPARSARQRLRALVQGMLRHTWENTHSGSKINELVSLIASQRQEVVAAKIQTQTSLIAEIIAAGNESGEFAVRDVIATARAVYASLTLFDVPLFMGLYPYEEFEALADEVVSLLLRGLEQR